MAKPHGSVSAKCSMLVKVFEHFRTKSLTISALDARSLETYTLTASHDEVARLFPSPATPRRSHLDSRGWSHDVVNIDADFARPARKERVSAAVLVSSCLSFDADGRSLRLTRPSKDRVQALEAKETKLRGPSLLGVRSQLCQRDRRNQRAMKATRGKVLNPGGRVRQQEQEE